MTADEVRAEYVAQLCAALDRLQAEEDAEGSAFLAVHPELRDNPAFTSRREFMCELFDRSECEWAYANVFRLWPPPHFQTDARILDLMQIPDVVWAIPSFGAKGDRVYVDVTVVDGDDSF